MFTKLGICTLALVYRYRVVFIPWTLPNRAFRKKPCSELHIIICIGRLYWKCIVAKSLNTDISVLAKPLCIHKETVVVSLVVQHPSMIWCYFCMKVSSFYIYDWCVFVMMQFCDRFPHTVSIFIMTQN